MNRRIGLLFAVVLVAAAALVWFLRSRSATDGGFARSNDAGTASAERPKPSLSAIGPRLVSNQTAYPLTLYGQRFTDGLTLQLGAPVNEALTLRVVDKTLAYARLPRELVLPDDQAQVVVTARIEGGTGEVPLTIVNDASYPDFFALAVSRLGDRYVISPTTDTLYVLRDDEPPFKLKTADGPYAIAADEDRVWVAHRFSPTLRAYAGLVQVAEVPGPAYASALVIDAEKHIAYVAETARDTVAAIELQTGKELWRAPVMPNPGALELCDGFVAVGSHQTGEVELLEVNTGEAQPPISPEPGMSIVGGGTAVFSHHIMGGKAPRALLCDDRRRVLFVSSIGPNIGPNAQKMEVSMNGGVGVIDLRKKTFVRHVGFGAGVTEGLAMDERGQFLFAADIGTGVVRTLEIKALLGSEKQAAQAVVAETAVPVRAGFPLIRTDFMAPGRAGPELHSGPRTLVYDLISKDWIVLNRHTGTLGRGAELHHAIALDDVKTQGVRRTGQVLYFADVGRTAMSCDGCHVEGHTEGLLFEKTNPLRIYRSNTLRGARDTPPYFIPASTFSLAETANVVGGRNRFHNRDLTPPEIEALASYSAALTLLPNPFRDEDGAPPDVIDLPDGSKGRPAKGRLLFDKQGCAGCHPPPLFTTDQDPQTRGRYVDVGTPRLFPLRESLQDATFKGFPPPSLLGNWDVWPQLTTGMAGFDVTTDGKLRVKDRYATKAVLERYSGPAHGNAQALSVEERTDLLAFLMTL